MTVRRGGFEAETRVRVPATALVSSNRISGEATTGGNSMPDAGGHSIGGWVVRHGSDESAAASAATAKQAATITTRAATRLRATTASNRGCTTMFDDRWPPV